MVWNSSVTASAESPKTQVNRNIIMLSVQDLKMGDKIDALDDEGDWWSATVCTVAPKRKKPYVDVSWDEFPSLPEEKIYEEDGRLRERKSRAVKKAERFERCGALHQDRILRLDLKGGGILGSVGATARIANADGVVVARLRERGRGHKGHGYHKTFHGQAPPGRLGERTEWKV